jgi:hypothetical protein
MQRNTKVMAGVCCTWLAAAAGSAVAAAPPPARPASASPTSGTSGPAQVNPGQAQPVVNPGQSTPGMVNPGRGDVGRTVSPAQAGLVSPGQAAPGGVVVGNGGLEQQQAGPPLVNPGQAGPGLISPGQLDGRQVNPGRMDGVVNPGQSDGRIISPGQVSGDIVNPGRGIPIFTVHPGQEGDSTPPAPGAIVSRAILVQKRMELTNPSMARRLSDVQLLPAEQQASALYDVIDTLMEVQRTATGTLVQTAQPAAPHTSETTPQQNGGIWVKGTPLKRSAQSSPPDAKNKSISPPESK